MILGLVRMTMRKLITHSTKYNEILCTKLLLENSALKIWIVLRLFIIVLRRDGIRTRG